METDNLIKRNEYFVLMNVGVVGLGFVGLSMSCVFAKKGLNIHGVDIDEQKVLMINHKKSPFFEPNINELLNEVLDTSLIVNSHLEQCIKKSEIIFVCVGTPSNSDGSSNLNYLKNTCKNISKLLNQIHDEKFRIIVIKSTVPPQTIETEIIPLMKQNTSKQIGVDFDICFNPEFLKEGSAIDDMLNPHLIVVGTNNIKTENKINNFYTKLYLDSVNIINTTIVNAELIKYTNNSFLATKISFINNIANICNKIPGADVEIIAEAIGMDPRIGKMFLKAGPGYGGSCFPKDVAGFLNFVKLKGYSMPILESTHKINENQPLVIIDMIKNKLLNIEGKTISILGLSFKKNTDDIREAVSIKIVKTLLEQNAKIKVNDPMAMSNFRQIFNDQIDYCDSIEDCLKESECCVILTEWDSFSKIEPEIFLKFMKNPILIDARRIFDINKFKDKVDLIALGYGI